MSDIPQDSFGIFRATGIAAEEPRAYSLPMKITVGSTNFTIGRELTVQTKRGNFLTPQMSVEGNDISLSYLMIGNANFPKLSRGIFQALMREARASEADERFDHILRFNKQKFLDLLKVLEPHDGEVIVMLRQMAYCQLEAMTHCIGTREL